MIRITCKANDGKRRAGGHHPQGVMDHADGTFTDDQLAQIAADPDFSVQRLEGEPVANAAQLETRSENDRLASELDEARAAIETLTAELAEARKTKAGKREKGSK